MTTWVVLDVSPSMAFGTAERLKADVAEGAVRRARPPGHPPRGTRGADGLRRRARARAAAAGRARRRRARVERAAARGGGARRAAETRTPSSAPSSRLGRMARLPGAGGGGLGLPRPARAGAAAARACRAPLGRGDRGARPARGRRCPRWAGCALVDPETGAQVEVDTRDRAPARALRGARARGARGRAAPSCAARGSDHVVLSTGRPVAARRSAGGFKPTRRPAAVSFQAPALPRGARRPCRRRSAAYALARRRRRRYAVRFTGAPTLAALVRRRAGLAPAPARRALRRRAGRARARARAPAGHRGGAGRAGLGPARDRRVGLDAGHRRGAHPAGRGHAAPRSTSSTSVPDEVRVGAVAFSTVSAHPRAPGHGPLDASRS